MKIEDARKFIELAKQLQKIIDCDASWETKYSFGFDLDFGIKTDDYCDPYVSYQDHLESYNYAVQKKAEEYQKVIDAIG